MVEVGAKTANGGGLELMELDLASLESVRACTDALIVDGRPFDVVIANAGVMRTPFGRTVDGFETQFGTNHLGHFMLVNRIASRIARAGRLANVSSFGHRYSGVDLDDPNFERTPYETRPLAMAGPRRPTSCSRWSSTGGVRRAGLPRRRCSRAGSRPNSAAICCPASSIRPNEAHAADKTE